MYAQAGAEMASRGSWLVPYLEGRPWFDKPVLFYDFEALSQRTLGRGSFAARLPSAIFAGLLAWLLARAARRWFGAPGAAGWTAWISLTAIYPAAVARAAVTDSLFVLTLAMAVVGFGDLLRGEAAARPPRAGAFAMAAGGLALATLTKGPVALVLIALLHLGYALATRHLRPLRSGRVWLAGTSGALLAAPWYLYMLARFGRAFEAGFFGRQNLLRYANAEHPGRPFWYFLAVLPLAFLPWTLFARELFRGRASELASPTAARPGFRPRAWLWSWAGVVTLFFSLSATKLPTYILPVIPAFSMLLGAAIAEASPRVRRRAAVAGGASAVLVAAAALLVAPAVSCYYAAASRAPDIAGARRDEPIYVYKGGLPGLLYYSGRIAGTLPDRGALLAALEQRKPFWMLLRPRHRAALAAELFRMKKIPGPSGPFGEGILLYHYSPPPRTDAP